MIYEVNLDTAPLLQILMNSSEILYVAINNHNENTKTFKYDKLLFKDRDIFM